MADAPTLGPDRFSHPNATTLMTQAAAALLAGITITSAATPALDGLYACDPATWGALLQTLQYTQVHDAFPLGITTLVRSDKAGASHSFTAIAEFQAFAAAIGNYTSALMSISTGSIQTMPEPTAAIP